MADGPTNGGFWSSVPGVLTSLAAIVTAGTGLYLATRPHVETGGGGSGGKGSDPVATQPAPVVAQPTPTPAAPTPERFTGPMGPLENGISYAGGDIYDRPATTADDCARVCANDDRCRAVTFVISQNRCWVKDRVNPAAQSSDMISSRKQPS